MLEIMIGTALLGAVLASAMLMNKQSESQVAGRNKADALASFQQLATQYFNNNRTDIEAAMGGDAAKQALVCRINEAADGSTATTAANSTKRTCAFDASHLVAAKLWPAGLSPNLPSNQMPVSGVNGGRYVAIARQIMNGATPTGADEILIVLAPLDASNNVMTTGTVAFSGTKDAFSDEQKASLNALGGTGGFIPPGTDYGPCQYNGTTKQACGNGWSVTLSNFIN